MIINAGAEDDNLSLAQKFSTMAPTFKLNRTVIKQFLLLCAELGSSLHIRYQDIGSAFMEIADQSLPGSTESDNGDVCSLLYDCLFFHQRSFNVAIAKNPKIIDTIQNLTTTLVSYQPFFLTGAETMPSKISVRSYKPCARLLTCHSVEHWNKYPRACQHIVDHTVCFFCKGPPRPHPIQNQYLPISNQRLNKS